MQSLMNDRGQRGVGNKKPETPDCPLQSYTKPPPPIEACGGAILISKRCFLLPVGHPFGDGSVSTIGVVLIQYVRLFI